MKSLDRGSIENKYYCKLVDFSYLEKYNLNVLAEIGRGGFGVVYKCQNKQKTKKYALKILFSTAFPHMISSELAFMRIMRDNVSMPKIINAFEHNYKFHFLMEYQKNDRFIV